MKPTTSVRRVSPEQTVRLRHRILWPAIPIDEQLLPYDTQPTTIHLGAFLADAGGAVDHFPAGLDKAYFTSNDETNGGGGGDASDATPWPVGNLTITHEAFSRPEILTPELRALEGRQVHKFAVHEALQGYGIGSRLFQSAVECVRDTLDNVPADHPGLLLHLDTRAETATFYQRLGMHVVDDEVFVKRGANGKGPPVSYIRMGLHIRPRHAA